MTKIQEFDFEGHKLRVEERDDKPWFFAADACNCLKLSNPSKSLSALDEDEKGLTSGYTLGGKQEQLLVSEGGLYTLVLRSRKATTPGTVQHRFRKWVTGEVLPAIRKTGSYSSEGVTVSHLDAATRRAIGGMIKSNAGLVIREALEPIQAEIKQAQIEIADLREKVESPITCTAGDLWRDNGFPPIKGGTIWLGNRLIELGCIPDVGSLARHGHQWRRLFDSGKARAAMRNGLRLLTERYVAERMGQGVLHFPKKGVAA